MQRMSPPLWTTLILERGGASGSWLMTTSTTQPDPTSTRDQLGVFSLNAQVP